MMMPMKLLRRRRATLQDLEARLQESIAQIPAAVEAALPRSRGTKVAVTVAWIAGGLGVVTLGLLAGRELRGRYKFKHRTPYDYYAHAGDQTPDLEFGVGI
jgi:hypothetical protein